MKKFQQNMSRELKRSSPDRLKLENQCISAIAFGSSDIEDNEESEDNTETHSDDPLRSPLWILVINIVAMEMLRSKLPPGKIKSPIKKKFKDLSSNCHFETKYLYYVLLTFCCTPRLWCLWSSAGDGRMSRTPTTKAMIALLRMGVM